jgi:hypothetical protein
MWVKVQCGPTWLFAFICNGCACRQPRAEQARRAIKGISNESVPAAEGAELDGNIFTDDLLLSLFESTMS